MRDIHRRNQHKISHVVPVNQSESRRNDDSPDLLQVRRVSDYEEHLMQQSDDARDADVFAHVV